ncbi:hypothetical protein ACFUV1_08420 [Streptomyces griseoincarnatus]|uniref:hypothetical protein n=1 Tax=Streptomyces TaxID=1883 RepID=UPI003625E635
MDAGRPDDEQGVFTLSVLVMSALALHQQGLSWEEVRAAFEAMAAAVTLWSTARGM